MANMIGAFWKDIDAEGCIWRLNISEIADYKKVLEPV